MTIGISGPLLSLKWGGMTLHPKGDEPEIEFSGRDYEIDVTGDGENFSKASNRKGYLKDTIEISLEDFAKLKKMQDGKFRAGTASTANGDVVSLNCAIDGECVFKNGEVELTLAGKVRKQ